MRRVIVSSLLALSPLAFAATEFTDAIPLELARSLLRGPFGDTLIYQDLPDDFPALDFPADFMLLGSADQGYSQTAVLALPEDTSDAQARMSQILENAGWKAIPTFVPPDTGIGFVSAQEQTQQPASSSRYCHDNQSGSVSLSELPQGERGILVVARQRSEGFMGGVERSCAEQIEQSQANQQRFMGGPGSPGGISTYTPRLEMPEVAGQSRNAPTAFMRMGGGGDASSDWETKNRISLDWSLQDLLTHFTPQLEAQGWTPEGSNVTGFLASSTWTRDIENGPRLLGILNILENGEGNFELKFRLIRRASTAAL